MKELKGVQALLIVAEPETKFTVVRTFSSVEEARIFIKQMNVTRHFQNNKAGRNVTTYRCYQFNRTCSYKIRAKRKLQPCQ